MAVVQRRHVNAMPTSLFSNSLSFVIYSALSVLTFAMLSKTLGVLLPSYTLFSLSTPVLSLSQDGQGGQSQTQNQSTDQASSSGVDLAWYPPDTYEVNTLSSALSGDGVYGFVFNSSETPGGTPYGTYNWCDMPHVRLQEYQRPSADYHLRYVEVIHRHHKRTPYASNTFPVEQYEWKCTDAAQYYYGASPAGVDAAETYWRVENSAMGNPFTAQGFPGDCAFPQQTRGGLDDSARHGKDLFAVYHGLLGLIPSSAPHDGSVAFRVTNNVITSQVAGSLVLGMFPRHGARPFPVTVESDGIDSLEPAYSCPAASSLSSSYGVGSSNPNWTAHLTQSQDLFTRLDAVSGVDPSSTDWHQSYDHYFDSFSARLCHDKALPCNVANPSLCVSQADANKVFRLGEYEYSFIYRDAGPSTLAASVASFGVWVAQLSRHLRDAQAGHGHGPVYRHNIAHDGSLSRLLSILQVREMVWPGMGAEIVFELYSTERHHGKWFVRILWGGRVLESSNPTIGRAAMVPLETLLAYFDGLVGRDATLIPGKCAS